MASNPPTPRRWKGCAKNGRAERRRNIAENYTIVTRPLDKKENYIKRCVAVAGDSLQIIDGRVYTNGVSEPEIPNKQYYYDIYNKVTGRVQTNCLLTDTELQNYADTTRYRLNKSLGYAGEMLIPHRVKTGWTLDDFGPVWVPKAGESIELNDFNVAMYGRCIAVYEGHNLEECNYLKGNRLKPSTHLQLCEGCISKK